MIIRPIKEVDIILETPDIDTVFTVSEDITGYETSGIKTGRFENATNEDVMLMLETLDKRIKNVTGYLETLMSEEFGYKIVR